MSDKMPPEKLAYYDGLRNQTLDERLKTAHLLENVPPRQPTPEELAPDPVRTPERA